ncbi:MAG TPA: radical SAM protein, partial [Blastocatellia bacterium]|nr:radical SAM protein [Blastocatellia bacterium]
QPALAGKRGSRAISRPLDFPRPDRGGLPGLEAYARLVNEGQEHLAGYAEATRGCLHLCTHCPIPPVYGGRFFAVPAKVVIEDIRGQVSSGARHITFGDPDFLNGPGHSLRIVRALHDEFPFLTFDFTAKVEHLIKYRGAVSELGALGCIFVVSAIESLSDTVLAHLEKGHRREDIYAALSICRIAGIALRPSFVSFTPWTRIGDYLDMLEFVDSQQLIDHVDPIQFAIRLLVPPGSLLLLRPDTGGWIGPLIEESFTYSWAHPDPAMDRLHGDVTGVVEHAAASQEDPADTFNRIAELAYHAGEKPQAKQSRVALEPSRTRPPHLTEAWFCCAEPTRGQFVSLQRKPGA